MSLDPSAWTAWLAGLAALSVILWPTVRPGGEQSRPDRHETEADPPRRSWSGWLRRLKKQRPARREVMMLDGLAAALEAGLSTEHALGVVLDAHPPGPEESSAWEELRRSARQGQALAPAWARLARRTGNATVWSVARAWSVTASTGAPLAAAARSSAQAARERHRLHRAIQVATAGARATALVLSLLPVAGVGLAALVGIGPAQLYGSSLSLASAGVGLTLLAGGHLIVRRLVTNVVGDVR